MIRCQMSKKILNLPALASQGAGRQAALVPLIGDEIIDMFAMDLEIADRGLLELPKKAQLRRSDILEQSP